MKGRCLVTLLSILGVLACYTLFIIGTFMTIYCVGNYFPLRRSIPILAIGVMLQFLYLYDLWDSSVLIGVIILAFFSGSGIVIYRWIRMEQRAVAKQSDPQEDPIEKNF